MAMIHVNRSGTSLGVFSEEDIRAGLRAVRFAPTDLGWREGMPRWQPLSQFTEFAADMAGGTGPEPAPTPPSTTGAAAAATLITMLPGAPAARSGLPWDHQHP